MRVIDVGAAPGGWSQIIAEKVDSQIGKETVVAVDLLEMDNVSYYILLSVNRLTV
jgi:23S rRNA (uridine2552-2'-O)-methyltransferase